MSLPFAVAPASVPPLRPYQAEWVRAVCAAFRESQRLLGVAATGAGKTEMAGELCRRAKGRVLFLADAQELVRQAADKIARRAGCRAGVVMGQDSDARLSDAVVVATTQTMARRLSDWSPTHFTLIIVDEAHRNTLGAQAMSVLSHFAPAKVLGITATPFRTDRKCLTTYYERIAAEIGLRDLIMQGFLSRIQIQQFPVKVDLRAVRTIAGDYNDADLGKAIAPALAAAADKLAEVMQQRKRAVVFLPLIETSQTFVRLLNARGVRSLHVDGTERAGLRGDWQVVCNAQLLTTGWDQPDLDTVLVLRPTKSLVMFSQMVGRGTRIHPGKTEMLLLDPLYLTDKLDVIRPARLLARTEEEAREVQQVLDLGDVGAPLDLLEAEGKAKADRERSMIERLAKMRQRKAKTVDALEFGLAIGDDLIANYEPEAAWEKAPPSPKQLATLAKFRIDGETITTKGLASLIMDRLFQRIELKLATPAQVRYLAKLGHPSPSTATVDEAKAFLDIKFSRNKS
jgi:superfamily II DNA or RNA helicase